MEMEWDQKIQEEEYGKKIKFQPKRPRLQVT